MSLTDDLADKLAQQALAIETRTGDASVPQQVADIIAASSATMEEAFLTAMRVRRAEARALDLLARLETQNPDQTPRQ